MEVQASRPFFLRTMSGEIPWVGCQFPTESLAQEAGMTLRQFEDFLYACSLQDFAELGREMHRYLARFDAAREVRIVAPGSDLLLSLEDRPGRVDTDWLHNVPSGEFCMRTRFDCT